jgi:hypothetical protein
LAHSPNTLSAAKVRPKKIEIIILNPGYHGMVEKTISRYCPSNSPVCFSPLKAGTDVVVLHMLERPGHNLPSVSPFVMKLETFLRYMNIRRHPSETFRDTLLKPFANRDTLLTPFATPF